MAWPSYVPPRVSSFFEERNRLAPRARGAPYWVGKLPKVESSDGTIGDQSHVAEGSKSDHNIGAHGFVHAADVSQSMPGTPYWDARCEQFDVFAAFHRIIADWNALDAAGRQRKYHWLKYLVWNEGGREVIWSPDRAGEGVRRNGSNTGHREHGHISIHDDPASEQDTQPIFGEDDDVLNADDKQWLKEVINDAAKAIAASVRASNDQVVERIGNYFPSK